MTSNPCSHKNGNLSRSLIGTDPLPQTSSFLNLPPELLYKIVFDSELCLETNSLQCLLLVNHQLTDFMKAHECQALRALLQSSDPLALVLSCSIDPTYRWFEALRDAKGHFDTLMKTVKEEQVTYDQFVKSYRHPSFHRGEALTIFLKAGFLVHFQISFIHSVVGKEKFIQSLKLEVWSLAALFTTFLESVIADCYYDVLQIQDTQVYGALHVTMQDFVLEMTLYAGIAVMTDFIGRRKQKPYRTKDVFNCERWARKFAKKHTRGNFDLCEMGLVVRRFQTPSHGTIRLPSSLSYYIRRRELKLGEVWPLDAWLYILKSEGIITAVEAGQQTFVTFFRELEESQDEVESYYSPRLKSADPWRVCRPAKTGRSQFYSSESMPGRGLVKLRRSSSLERLWVRRSLVKMSPSFEDLRRTVALCPIEIPDT